MRNTNTTTGVTMLMPSYPMPGSKSAAYTQQLITITGLEPKSFQQNNQSLNNEAAFGGLISSAGTSHTKRLASRGFALDHGVDEEALERYASGACSLYERDTMDDIVARCKWARDYVVSLIKSRRNSP